MTNSDYNDGFLWDFMGFYDGLMGFYGIYLLVNITITVGNDHRNSGFVPLEDGGFP